MIESRFPGGISGEEMAKKTKKADPQMNRETAIITNILEETVSNIRLPQREKLTPPAVFRPASKPVLCLNS